MGIPGYDFNEESYFLSLRHSVVAKIVYRGYGTFGVRNIDTIITLK